MSEPLWGGVRRLRRAGLGESIRPFRGDQAILRLIYAAVETTESVAAPQNISCTRREHHGAGESMQTIDSLPPVFLCPRENVRVEFDGAWEDLLNRLAGCLCPSGHEPSTA